MWSAGNWSCAYDAVFMAFWSLYRGSSSSWRKQWRRQAPRWANFLGAAFDSLLSMNQHAHTSRAVLSQEFTSFRDKFRDELFQTNPVCFRRHGMVPASVCCILSQILGDFIECEPHLNQLVTCDQCGTPTCDDRCSFALLGSTLLLDKYYNDNDLGLLLPLQTAMTRYIQHFSREPHLRHCSACSGLLTVQSLSIPEMPWLWIEICDPVSSIIPSRRLVFGLHHQHPVYTLQAVIYHGGNHFTARLSYESASWWKYDGRWSFGAPCMDNVKDEVDLLENNGRGAAFLLYRQADLQD